MEKRKLDSLNAEISLLGFGLMRLPVIGADKSKIDYAKAQAMIDRAYKAGVNYYDTGYPYHEGMSEVFTGEALSKYPRESYYLATKMPTWDLVKSKDDVTRIFGEQLKKCKTDYFDFYLAHSLGAENEKCLKNYVYDFLRKKKEEGVIRRLGFSFHDKPDVLREIVKNYEWEFAQIQLNYLDWDTAGAKDLFEILAESRLPVIIMEPVKGGALASLNVKALDVFKKADPASSAASWAMRFAASLPNVATVLSGMSDLSHVEDNIKTFSPFKPLSEAERKVIAEASGIYYSTETVPCTGCRYCMDCPSGVDIPGLLDIYNHYLLSKNKFAFFGEYNAVKESGRAHNCNDCGACVKLCPQRIDVQKHLKDIAALAAK